MALDDDIELLSKVPLLRNITSEQLRLLAYGAEKQRAIAQREIYRKGSPANCAYVIIEGTVFLHNGETGKNEISETVGPPALLGELALIAPTTRKTHAIAKSDVYMMRINRTLFRRLMEEYPEVAVDLYKHFANQFIDVTNQIAKVHHRFE